MEVHPDTAHNPVSGQLVGLRMSTIQELLLTLKSRRARLKEQIEAIDKAVSALENAANVLANQKFDLAEDSFFGAFGIDTDGDKPRRQRGIIPPQEIVRHVRSVLLDAGHPMTRSQIARELINRDVPLVGGDINKNIGTILWRNPRDFVNLPNLGYWLADVPLAGVHVPADPEPYD
jgi:hypothetical protein